MKIKDKKTGYYYIGFDSGTGRALWAKNKIQSTKIDERIIPQVIKQLSLLQYDVEESPEE